MERWYLFLFQCPKCKWFTEKIIECNGPQMSFGVQPICHSAVINQSASICGTKMDLINLKVKVI